jgi:hypothetical protein
MSAPNASELTEIINKVLQSVSEWAIKNKLVLNTSKTKSIVFGSKGEGYVCYKNCSIERPRKSAAGSKQSSMPYP